MPLINVNYTSVLSHGGMDISLLRICAMVDAARLERVMQRLRTLAEPGRYRQSQPQSTEQALRELMPGASWCWQ